MYEWGRHSDDATPAVRDGDSVDVAGEVRRPLAAVEGGRGGRGSEAHDEDSGSDLDMNDNRTAGLRIDAAERAAAKEKHAAKVLRDKVATAAAREKREQAKKAAQERSKKNERNRGGRGL